MTTRPSPPATLLVLLAGPPTTSGVRTLNRVRDAAEVLGAGRVIVGNLFGIAARDLPHLSAVGSTPEGWERARLELAALPAVDAVLAAWGLHGLAGEARRHRQRQLLWLREHLGQAGHHDAWCLGGQARHPSRWHQYVSDRHGRTGPGDFRTRLREVLKLEQLDKLCC